MAEIEQIDILIVGSGPAGMSTALHLAQRDPGWADRIVVVDKAVHPREKLCGGGITHLGQDILFDLGLESIPNSYEVREARLLFQNESYSFYGNPVFRVVRRDEFDHWLVRTAEQQGVQVRQGEAVKQITVHDQYVEVVTEKSHFRAKALVAADGSRSYVRQTLKWPGPSHVARLLEILTPEDASVQPGFRDAAAVFDFTKMSQRLQGYYWDFPSYVNGKPFMNRGLFDGRVRPERPKAELKKLLAESLNERDRLLDDYPLKGHPIRWWDRNGCFAMPRVLLVGDAAGADVLMGEGISFALGYGRVAAVTLAAAFERRRFDFEDYRGRLLGDSLFKHLDLRTRLARLAYGIESPAAFRIGWRVARWVIRFTRWHDREFRPAKADRQL